jgi:hypothetical protein
MATKLISRVRTDFGVSIQLRDFFTAPTIKALAERLEEAVLLASDSEKLDEMLNLLEGIDEEEAQKMLPLDDDR